MTRRLLIAAAIAAVITGCNNDKTEEPAVKLESDEQKVSYGMGLNLGKRIKEEFALDVTAFSAGVRHAFDGTAPLMSDDQIMATMQSFQKKQIEAREAEFKAQAEKNKADGEAFRAANRAKEGVKETESGLQYRVLVEGKGEKPGPEDVVEVNYRGTLIDGTEFDSSYKRGESVTFPLSGVIPGWTEGLQLMPVGSKYELVIPSELAYGPGGTGPIGPNATLVFEVELLDIKKPEADAK
jgi:FKBP-type peptidyl-prolyl cis-trans isomerase